MYSLKKYLLLLPFLFVGCNNEQPIEPYQDLFGLYKSSAFIEPGSLDGGVNIQLSGGYLNITLRNNYEFTAELFIPDSINSNYGKGFWNYEGNYSLKSDTIEFTSQSFIIKYINWDKQNKQLESFEVPPRGRPFKIILYKYSR
ncbi:MAG: hypothetical protein ABIG69_14930 [Bacteroidota bacterium]